MGNKCNFLAFLMMSLFETSRKENAIIKKSARRKKRKSITVGRGGRRTPGSKDIVSLDVDLT